MSGVSGGLSVPEVIRSTSKQQLKPKMLSSRRRKPLATSRKVLTDEKESNDDDNRMTYADIIDTQNNEDIPEDLLGVTVKVELEVVEETTFKGPEFPPIQAEAVKETTVKGPEFQPIEPEAVKETTFKGSEFPPIKSEAVEETTFKSPEFPQIQAEAVEETTFKGPEFQPIEPEVVEETTFMGPEFPPIQAEAVEETTFMGLEFPQIESEAVEETTFKGPEFPSSKKKVLVTTMALTNAEKQRRFREKRNSDTIRRAEYLQKRRQKYREDLANGRRQLVKDLTDREKRTQREQWREYQKSRRQRQKVKIEPQTPQSSQSPIPSHQQVSSAKRREQSKAQCYRDNDKLRLQLEEEKRKTNMYKQRWLREKEKSNERTQGKHLFRGRRVQLLPKEKRTKRSKARKPLVFHFVVKEALQQKYMNGGRQVKKTLSEMLSVNIMRKYGLLNEARKGIGIQKNGQRVGNTV